MIMLFLQKAWSFLKNYWYIPLLGIVAIIVFLVMRKRDIIDWARILENAQKSHRDEVAAIEKIRADEIDAANKATKRMMQAEEQIRADFERNQRILDAKKEKRVKKILNDLKHDPQGMANEIEKETGVRVLIVE